MIFRPDRAQGLISAVNLNNVGARNRSDQATGDRDSVVKFLLENLEHHVPLQFAEHSSDEQVLLGREHFWSGPNDLQRVC